MKLYPAHECPQGSAEWHRARAGVITASMVDTVRNKVGGLDEKQAAYVAAIKAGATEAEAMLKAGYKAKPKATAVDVALAGGIPGDWSDAAKNYAFKLAIERITGMALGDDEFNPWQAVRGSKLEEEARMEHEIAADVMVQTVGFVTSDDGKFGASADGWIEDNGGAEYKCFLTTSKLRPILLDGDTSFVYAQCQMNMALCPGRTWWHFGLYLPDLRVIGRHFTLIHIDRDEAYIEAMWKDLRDFDALVESYKARLIAGAHVAAPNAPPAQAPEPASVHVDTCKPEPARPVLQAVAPDALPELF
jgi:hypothetical protein